MIKRQSVKQVLAKSIIELMNEKPLKKITVKMISDNCNVTRQTFYYHFKDKFDLVNWIFRTLIDNIILNSPPSLPWNNVLGEMLAEMKKYQKFYINAMNYEGQNSFLYFITDYTRITYVKELTKRLDSNDLSDDILFSIEFNSFGAVGMISNWIKDNMSTDPYKLAARIADNMPLPMKEHF